MYACRHNLAAPGGHNTNPVNFHLVFQFEISRKEKKIVYSISLSTFHSSPPPPSLDLLGMPRAEYFEPKRK